MAAAVWASLQQVEMDEAVSTITDKYPVLPQVGWKVNV